MEKPDYSFRLTRSDEDECYVAMVPEFEGVSGFGATPQEALAEAQVSLQLAIETYTAEGWPLPKPESLNAYSGQFRLRLPRSMHARLAQVAADEGMSLNSYTVCLISHGLGQTDALQKLRKEIHTLIIEHFSKARGSATAMPAGPWGCSRATNSMTQAGVDKWPN